MSRLHLFELGDQAWVPGSLRDLLTDTLRFGITRFGFYAPVAPLLAGLLRRMGTSEVVDLCSGATGPWETLAADLRRRGVADLRVTFTDVRVNERARRAVVEPGLVYLPQPVDATAVPPELRGVRTLFTSFHHLRPEDARRVLEAARSDRAAIAVFEFTERTVASCVAAFLVPLGIALATPWIRPVSALRLLLTYPVPLIPLCSLWDGLVSSLRSYSPEELATLVEGLGDGYRWEIGRIPATPPITFLIGSPE